MTFHTLSLRPAIAVAALCLVAACAGQPPGSTPGDPYEATNRQIHEFNKSLDEAMLRVAGQGAAQVPEEIRVPVVNFSDNVSLPGMALNGFLQGDIEGAVTNTLRFLINSTIGLLGLGDPATLIGLDEQETDFGETLSVWGVPEGAYVELPLLGPSTERDVVGRLVDFLIDPLEHVGRPEMVEYGTAARVAERIIERGTFGDTFDSVLYDSADSYTQTRLIYLQNRRFELGMTDDDAYLDPYADPYIDPDEAAE